MEGDLTDREFIERGLALVNGDVDQVAELAALSEWLAMCLQRERLGVFACSLVLRLGPKSIQPMAMVAEKLLSAEEVQALSIVFPSKLDG